MSQVTVIIPAFQAERHLASAIDSVLSQPVATEVVVVDDGSTDATGVIAKRYGDPVRYVRQSNQGVSAARNHGLSLAKSPWVVFLDADDELEAQALGMQFSVASLSAGTAVCGSSGLIDETGASLGRWDPIDCDGPAPSAARASFQLAQFAPGAVLVPRKAALSIGGFDERFSTCADRHFWIRLGSVSRFLDVNAIVHRYRKVAGTMSQDRALHAYESVAVRLDALRWAESRHISIFPERPSDVELLSSPLRNAMISRKWKSVDALLRLATEQKISSRQIEIARLRRCIPSLVYSLVDMKRMILPKYPSEVPSG